MTVSVTSPADCINAALVRIGFKGRVGSLYDGSEPASRALDIYGQTRDAVLRAGNWHFAGRTVALALLKSAPSGGYFPSSSWDPAIYPMSPQWLYEYTYPSDCLKIRAVIPAPTFPIDFSPQPNVFAEENDNNYTPARKVILTNVANAVCNYTGRVTNPSTWEANFTEALIDELARRLAPVLKDMDAAKFEAGAAAAAVAVAERTQG